MAKTFVIKTKDGKQWGPLTRDDATAARLASQAALKGDQYIEIPQQPAPAVKPSKQPIVKPTTGGPPSPSPPLPIPKPESALLPPQTAPDPLFKQKEQIAKEQTGSTRSFLGGLADGLTLGATLDDISKVQDEGSPVEYGGGRFAGEALANVIGEGALILAGRGRISPQAAATIAGGVTGAFAGGIESKKETGEVSPSDILTGGAAGAAGGYAGGFIGAPQLRKMAKSAGKVLEPLIGMAEPAGERAAARAAAEKQAKVVEEKAVEGIRKKSKLETAEALHKAREEAYENFKKELTPNDQQLLDEADKFWDEIDPEDIEEATRGLTGQKTRLISAKRIAKEKAEQLAEEVKLMGLSEEQSRIEFRKLADKVDVPTGFKNYVKEYADYYLSGAAGSALASRGPALAERAKEKAEQMVGAVKGIPVNQTMRQKEAMAAMQRLAEAEAAQRSAEEEYKRRGTGQFDIRKSALAPK